MLFLGKMFCSCGAAAESSLRRQPWVIARNLIKPRQGRQKNNQEIFLSPLPGLDRFFVNEPTVSPWAPFFCASGAGTRF
jgi:hypothetical protein